MLGLEARWGKHQWCNLSISLIFGLNKWTLDNSEQSVKHQQPLMMHFSFILLPFPISKGYQRTNNHLSIILHFSLLHMPLSMQLFHLTNNFDGNARQNYYKLLFMGICLVALIALMLIQLSLFLLYFFIIVFSWIVFTLAILFILKFKLLNRSDY